MDLPKLCTFYFGFCNLYDVLGLDKKCDAAAVKHAFFKRSLKHYFDGVNDEDEIVNLEAMEKLKILFKVYSILSDKERKWVYDETGCVWLDEELLKKNFNWIGHWKLIFDNPSKESLESFVNNYIGSEEESTDIKYLTKLYKGDVSKILEILMCPSPEDETRIRAAIQYKNCASRSNLLKLTSKKSSINALHPKLITSTTSEKAFYTEPLSEVLKSKECKVESDELAVQPATKATSGAFAKQIEIIDSVLNILKECKVEKEEQATPPSTLTEKMEIIIENALEKLKKGKTEKVPQTTQLDNAAAFPFMDSALVKFKTIKIEREEQGASKKTTQC